MQRQLTIRVPADLPVVAKEVRYDLEDVQKQKRLHLPLLVRGRYKQGGGTLHDPYLDSNVQHCPRHVAPCPPEVGAGPGACAVHQLNLPKPQQPGTDEEDRQRSYYAQDVD